MNYNIKIKPHANILKYLKEYNKKMLDNYLRFIDTNQSSKYQGQALTNVSLPPKDPNYYLKMFSITHIFSFLAGYYLSNLFK